MEAPTATLLLDSVDHEYPHPWTTNEFTEQANGSFQIPANEETEDEPND